MVIFASGRGGLSKGLQIAERDGKDNGIEKRTCEGYERYFAAGNADTGLCDSGNQGDIWGIWFPVH